MDLIIYQDVLEKCCLAKDLEMLAFGDLTKIGERGVNLSNGQKQWVQLARALYQDADVYLLDDPFSTIDAHTATSLFNEYVMEALSGKTVLLVTHQLDFLPAFNSILNSLVGRAILIAVYSIIGCILAALLLLRSYSLVILGYKTSEFIFSSLLRSLFRAPMSFYDSTPLVSFDMSIVDLDLAFKLSIAVDSVMNAYSSFIILGILAWLVLFVIIPMIYLTIFFQLMRMNGTTKSSLASYLAESIFRTMTIRAFEDENRFFSKNLQYIDMNASTSFHSYSANEWLVQCLEMICAIVLSSSTLAMTFLPLGPSASG
ncbi:hypothetical protein Pint_15046 [Pistacia integerrima]|uniref:Uncharacterized protein n=1 Tax=Pistacia integerrima TaxID=434235 RepID=A0ACC0ZB29_9ROSI|nr:hypothetical protein Pint_15046 [Pistacia integerrima]